MDLDLRLVYHFVRRLVFCTKILISFIYIYIFYCNFFQPYLAVILKSECLWYILYTQCCTCSLVIAW